MASENSYESPYRFLTSVIKELKCLALANMEYFQNGNQSYHAKFHSSFCLLYEYLDQGIEPIVVTIFPKLSEFDASPEVKGNGYRSLLRVIHKCCTHLVQLLRHITINRDSMLFRKANYCKEVEAYVATLGQLRACLYYSQKLMSYCADGNLFSDEDDLNNTIAEQLLSDVETLNEDCFYGRCLGFQFCYSMQRPLNVVAIAMASFSEGYQENSQIMKLATSIISSGKYLFNPELRAQQVVNITRSADVNFCKAFWSITETDIMKQLPSFVCPVVQVDEVLYLGPDSFEMPTEDGSDVVVITPPCAHTGPGSVQVRLISYVLREGQHVHQKKQGGRQKAEVKMSAKTPGLVIHCHGGGFVAQSSKSHEVYLRHWAKELNVPILSIDYSLAPEFPFPRALEECFYAYAWAVQNVEKLGSTGERICLAGDSAGGNLMISTAMRAASFGIRKPDGIMAAYTPVMVRYTPSPSRLLTLMDPLLPVGILSRCLAAYAGVSDKLATGLASTVFPGNDNDAVNLKVDESSEEWIIVSRDDETEITEVKLHTRNPTEDSPQTEVKVVPSSDDTKVKVQIGSVGKSVEKQEKVYPDLQDKLEKVESEVVHHDLKEKFDENQVKVCYNTKQKSADTDSGVQLDERHVKVEPGSEVKVDQDVTKERDITSETQPDEKQDEVELSLDNREVKGQSTDMQVRVQPDEIQVKMDVDETQVKVRVNSEESFDDTRVSMVCKANSDDLRDTDSPVSWKMEELLPHSNMDDLHVESATSSVSLEVHPPTIGSAANSEDILDIDKSSSGSPCILANGNNNNAKDSSNLPPPSAGDLKLKNGDAVHGAGDFSDVSLTNTPLEETSLFREYEIIDPETIPVCNSIESKSSSSSLSDSDHETTRASGISVAELLSVLPKSCNGMRRGRGKSSPVDPVVEPTKKKKSRKEKVKETTRTHKTHKVLAPFAQPIAGGCCGDSAEGAIAAAAPPPCYADVAKKYPCGNRDILDLNLAGGDASLPKCSSPRLVHSPSAPVFKKNCPKGSPGPTDFVRHRHHGQSPLQAMRHLPIVKNPYMSPLLAPSHMLESLPHVCLVACHLDPILDDSVMFAKKLNKLGKSVDLHLIDDLPHGFLNFALVSKEAKQASDVCVAKIRKVLNME